MDRFVEDDDRRQSALLPACLDDYLADDNPVRVVDAFVNELDLLALDLPVTFDAYGAEVIKEIKMTTSLAKPPHCAPMLKRKARKLKEPERSVGKR